MERMGMEGRQATLPSESSTQEEDRGWSQGRLRIPRNINHSMRMNCSGDSRLPTIDFISVAFCSNSRNFSLLRLDVKLLFSIKTLTYMKVGTSGKNMMAAAMIRILSNLFSF